MIVTFGIGAFFQSSNARPRGDDWGSISLLMSKSSCSVSLFGVAKILLFYVIAKKWRKGLLYEEDHKPLRVVAHHYPSISSQTFIFLAIAK